MIDSHKLAQDVIEAILNICFIAVVITILMTALFFLFNQELKSIQEYHECITMTEQFNCNIRNADLKDFQGSTPTSNNRTYVCENKNHTEYEQDIDDHQINQCWKYNEIL